jgi:hypothetical protein
MTDAQDRLTAWVRAQPGCDSGAPGVLPGSLLPVGGFGAE